MSKFYQLWLPVFKQGDDLGGCLKHAKEDSAAAFLLQAETYDEAARICRLMAGRCKESGVEILHADTHHISIGGPPEVLDVLVKDEILLSDEFDDEDECQEGDDLIGEYEPDEQDLVPVAPK